jgi:hypothetical protein
MNSTPINSESKRALVEAIEKAKTAPHGSTRPVHAGVAVPVTASGLY